MPAQYDQEVIEECRKLYCKYGGRNHDAIEREMQVHWPGWKKQNLIDRGKGKDQRLGWITKYGFDNSLKLWIEKQVESVNDDEQDLYLAIKAKRKDLQGKAMGRNATDADVKHFRDFAKLEIEARRNLDLSRDNFETFVASYEKTIGWLAQIDPAAAKLLVKNGEKLSEMAAAHYGKQEENDGGAGAGEDESGE